MEQKDEQLIADHLNGDEYALPMLIERHLTAVYSFVYRLIGNQQDAEDITQEVFIRVWRNAKRYNADYSFRPWLFTIARNAAIDWMRKKKSAVFSDFENSEGENTILDTLADVEPLPNEITARAMDKKILENALNKIPPMYREVVVLRYESSLTFEEIRQIVDRPLDTVKSQHRRALIMLRKLLVDLIEP